MEREGTEIGFVQHIAAETEREQETLVQEVNSILEQLSTLIGREDLPIVNVAISDEVTMPISIEIPTSGEKNKWVVQVYAHLPRLESKRRIGMLSYQTDAIEERDSRHHIISELEMIEVITVGAEGTFLDAKKGYPDIWNDPNAPTLLSVVSAYCTAVEIDE